MYRILSSYLSVIYVNNWKETTNSILNAFEKRNQKKLRKINDDVLKETVISFTKLAYELAVISYVLSKIISKPRFLAKENEGKMQAIEKSISELAKAANDTETLEKCKTIMGAIKLLERDDARFIIDLVSKGRLKVAATAYAQGVSLGIASEMTGMDKQEIMDYAGKTMMFDRVKDEKGIEERLTYARKLIKR